LSDPHWVKWNVVSSVSGGVTEEAVRRLITGPLGHPTIFYLYLDCSFRDHSTLQVMSTYGNRASFHSRKIPRDGINRTAGLTQDMLQRPIPKTPLRIRDTYGKRRLRTAHQGQITVHLRPNQGPPGPSLSATLGIIRRQVWSWDETYDSEDEEA